MNKISKNIIYMLIVLTLIFINCFVSKVYAYTEEEAELMQLLTEYKDNLGDLNKFKQVIDKAYNDISSTTTVDDNLKAQLTADIAELENVTNINPLILNALEVELSSHVANMTNENLDEVKHEFAIIKEWVDSQVTSIPDDSGNNNASNPNDSGNNSNPDNSNNGNSNEDQKVDDSVVNDSKLPNTGKSISIILIILFLLSNIFICIKKYKNYEQI